MTISRPPPAIECPQSVNSVCGGSERYTAWTALCCSIIEFHTVSLCNLTMCTTSHICMQCLTDLICLLVAVKRIFKNPQSGLLYRFFRQSFELDYPAVKFLPPCQIQILSTPCCSRFWSVPKWTCLHSWFELTYFTNHLWCLVGFNECRLHTAYCMD